MPFNSNDKTSKIILSNGDRTVALTSGTGEASVRALYGLSSGKWYMEFQFTSRTDSTQWIGFANTSHNLANYPGQNTNSWGLQLINTAFGAGKCWALHNGSYVEHTVRPSGNGVAVVRVALDLDNKKVWYSTSGAWDGDPTDPVSGGFAHDFSGNTDDLYIVFYGARNSSGFSAGTVYFADGGDWWNTAPAGYSAMADGFPVLLSVIEGELELLGQETEQTGGVFPVYLEVPAAAELDLQGQPTVPDGGKFDTTGVYFEHHLAGPSCLLQARRDFEWPFNNVPPPPPVTYARAATPQSVLVNQLLTGGKWVVGCGNANWKFTNEYVYENILFGLCRPHINLDGGLGLSDEWMFSLGAWNSSPRLFHEGKVYTNWAGTFPGYLGGMSLAIDFSDITNGKVYYYNNKWFDATPPITDYPASPVIEGLVGPWYVCATVTNDFEISINSGKALSGYTSLVGSTQTATAGLWAASTITSTASGDLTNTDLTLLNSVGNHLLRSATWKKRTQYYLALLTSMDPVTEPTLTENGYARQVIPTYNEYWNTDFTSVQRYTFQPFDGTIVGWALFIRPSPLYDLDPVVFKQQFPVPFVCASTSPGPTFPPGAFSWSFD